MTELSQVFCRLEVDQKYIHMKSSVIRNMTTEYVKDTLAEWKASYSKLRMTHKITPIENPVGLRMQRRVIARLNTELRKRELGQ